jgi:hypothetical protein
MCVNHFRDAVKFCIKQGLYRIDTEQEVLTRLAEVCSDFLYHSNGFVHSVACVMK